MKVAIICTHMSMLERGLVNPSLRAILSTATALKMSRADLVGFVESALGDPWREPKKRIKRRDS